MSSFTFADNKTGGRLTAICDAIAAGHLRRAAGILNEVADELNQEAEATTGLLADDPPAEIPAEQPPEPARPVKGQPDSMDLQSCARGAHSFPQVPDSNGWFTCLSCGYVVVTPPGVAM